MGTEIKEGDVTMQMFVSSTHDDLLVFTDRGRVFKLKVYEIPEAGRTSRGRAIVNVLNLQEGEKVREFMTIHDFEKEEAYLLFSTERGLVKRTPLKAYHNVNRAGLIAINLREDDSLIGVTWTSGSDHILLGTSAGMAIRFEEAGARETGRNAMGVKGIDLRGEDRVVGLVRCEPNDQRMLLSVTANGYGKQTPLSDYLVQPEGGEPRPQSRGGKGRRDIATTDRNGEVVCLLAIEPGDDLLLITRNGIIARIPASSVRQTSRGTQGVRVINLGQDDRLAGVARIPAEEAEEAALAQAEEQAGQAPGALEQADIAPDEAPPFGVSPDETLGHEWAEPPADESPADDSEDLDESGDTDLA
jgi:DNA gyrase subunit A